MSSEPHPAGQPLNTVTEPGRRGRPAAVVLVRRKTRNADRLAGIQVLTLLPAAGAPGDPPGPHVPCPSTAQVGPSPPFRAARGCGRASRPGPRGRRRPASSWQPLVGASGTSWQHRRPVTPALADVPVRGSPASGLADPVLTCCQRPAPGEGPATNAPSPAARSVAAHLAGPRRVGPPGRAGRAPWPAFHGDSAAPNRTKPRPCRRIWPLRLGHVVCTDSTRRMQTTRRIASPYRPSAVRPPGHRRRTGRPSVPPDLAAASQSTPSSFVPPRPPGTTLPPRGTLTCRFRISSCSCRADPQVDRGLAGDAAELHQGQRERQCGSMRRSFGARVGRVRSDKGEH